VADTHDIAADVASRLVAALERTWATIQRRHPDVPDVVVITGTGTGRAPGGLVLGYFAERCWRVGDDDRHELFIGGEGLRLGAHDVLATMLHEAGHGLATTRAIKDTSRQGRYHNAKYKALAEELGIDVAQHPLLGYSITTLPDRTASLYAPELAILHETLTLHRRLVGIISQDSDSPEHGKVTPPADDPERPVSGAKRRPAYVCGCPTPRTIRMANATFEAGPILCGVCGQRFEAAEANGADRAEDNSLPPPQVVLPGSSAHPASEPAAAA